jgi:hypothetical protein
VTWLFDPQGAWNSSDCASKLLRLKERYVGKGKFVPIRCFLFFSCQSLPFQFFADHRCKWRCIADVGDEMGDRVCGGDFVRRSITGGTRQTKHEMKNVDIVAMKCKIR